MRQGDTQPQLFHGVLLILRGKQSHCQVIFFDKTNSNYQNVWSKLFTTYLNIFLGDDQSVSIQMRGGPEPMMVTSWAQIMSLDPSYIGIYHCIATNNMGSVAAFADVGVYNNEL